MAGQPETQRRMKLLDDESAEILEQLEQGESMRRIAVRITDKLEEPISEALIGRWLQLPANEALAIRARERAANSRAERVLDRTDELVTHVALGIKGRDDIAAVREANAVDQWIAGIWNRNKYAQQNGVAVTVNVANVHLDSLRQAPAVAAHRPPELLAFDAEDVAYVDVAPVLRLEDLL